MTRTHKDTKKYREAMCEKVKAWPCGSAPKSFKKTMARKRKAKDKQAIREGREPEKWKQTDDWDWF